MGHHHHHHHHDGMNPYENPFLFCCCCPCLLVSSVFRGIGSCIFVSCYPILRCLGLERGDDYHHPHHHHCWFLLWLLNVGWTWWPVAKVSQLSCFFFLGWTWPVVNVSQLKKGNFLGCWLLWVNINRKICSTLYEMIWLVSILNNTMRCSWCFLIARMNICNLLFFSNDLFGIKYDKIHTIRDWGPT